MTTHMIYNRHIFLLYWNVILRSNIMKVYFITHILNAKLESDLISPYDYVAAALY